MKPLDLLLLFQSTFPGAGPIFRARHHKRSLGYSEHGDPLGARAQPGEEFQDSRGRVYTRDHSGTVRYRYTKANGRPR